MIFKQLPTNIVTNDTQQFVIFIITFFYYDFDVIFAFFSEKKHCHIFKKLLSNMADCRKSGQSQVQTNLFACYCVFIGTSHKKPINWISSSISKDRLPWSQTCMKHRVIQLSNNRNVEVNKSQWKQCLGENRVFFCENMICKNMVFDKT